MTSIRKLLFLVTMIALAAFALPAIAAKTITMTVPGGPLAAGAQQIQVSVNNTGNSNANSFEIDWIPSANFSVQSGFISSEPSNQGTMLSTGTYGSPYKGIVFNKQAPQKTSVTVTLNVTVTSTCASTPVTWQAAAWTGSPGPLSTTFTLQGGPYSTSIASLPNCISCNTATNPVFPPVPSTGYFANLPAGVTTVSQPGFAAGYRLNNDKGDACQLVEYAFTNNITGSGSTTDANGNMIPPNTAALAWNLTAQPNAVFVYVLTFLPEYVDVITGLPNKKTKFCILGTGPTDCTIAANQADLKACIGTALSATSIPGADPACILNETWTTVPQADCASLPNPNGSNPPPACVRATDTLIDGRDPPIIRP